MQPIYVFAGAFSCMDTAAFRARANAEGFRGTAAQYPARYRNNDRVVVHDERLAEQVMARMRAHIPAQLVDDQGQRWRLRGLNPRFRFCRYRDGQAFSVHRDGVYYAGARAQSKLTFMIYLNDADEFTGGDTRFFSARDRATTTMTLAPRRGTLIVFDHALWHEGTAVTAGTKYVMRSDVIYERDADDTDCQSSGHQGYVWQLARLRDGRIASSGRDTTIRMWHVGETLDHASVLRGHLSSVSALAAVGDAGMWSGSRDGIICRWQGDKKLSQRVAHDGAVLSIVELPGGDIATSSADGAIKLWRADGTALATLRDGGEWVWQLAARSDGVVVAAGEDGLVEMWSPASGTKMRTLALGEPVRCVAVTDDWGIVAGGSDGTICTWYGNEIRSRFRGHHGAVRALAQLPGRGIVSVGEDDVAHLWNGGEQPAESFAHDDFVTAISAVDNRRFVTASYDGTVRLWTCGLN